MLRWRRPAWNLSKLPATATRSAWSIPPDNREATTGLLGSTLAIPAASGWFLKRHARPRLFDPEERRARREALTANPEVPAEAVPVIEAISGDDELTISLSADVGMYFSEVLRGSSKPSMGAVDAEIGEYHSPC
jgi:hypothetical protein